MRGYVGRCISPECSIIFSGAELKRVIDSVVGHLDPLLQKTLKQIFSDCVELGLPESGSFVKTGQSTISLWWCELL